MTPELFVRALNKIAGNRIMRGPYETKQDHQVMEFDYHGYNARVEVYGDMVPDKVLWILEAGGEPVVAAERYLMQANPTDYYLPERTWETPPNNLVIAKLKLAGIWEL